jgi:hypothetical protein
VAKLRRVIAADTQPETLDELYDKLTSPAPVRSETMTIEPARDRCTVPREFKPTPPRD